jgi:hypothetical protein
LFDCLLLSRKWFSAIFIFSGFLLLTFYEIVEILKRFNNFNGYTLLLFMPLILKQNLKFEFKTIIMKKVFMIIAIVAGTLDRGVLEAALPCDFEPEPVVIEGNEEWSSVHYIHSNIEIEQGATLTITGEVYMAEQAGITVKRGGLLLIDGGRITNDCNGLWKGIQVWGDPKQDQVLPYQGIVMLRNNAVIENAKAGIRTVKIADTPPGDNDLVDLNYSGGMVQAAQAVFRNNKAAIVFFKYPANGYTFKSRSFINNTDFIADNDYFLENGEYTFADLKEIDGVKFTFCRFRNQTGYEYFGTGIKSFNSTFFIEGKCTGGNPCEVWENGEFNNLEYGIYATAGKPLPFADIRHTDFDGNYKGVYIGGMTNARITDNRFLFYDTESEDNYGLYLNQSTAYKIEENFFELVQLQNHNGIGLIINNSVQEPNLIYRNTFYRLDYGIIAQNNNRDAEGNGLQLKCNTFDYCAFDQVITWDETLNEETGIAANQGSSSPNPEDMAGNLFYIPPGPVNGDFDDINNEANHIVYFYPLNNDDLDVIPVDYTENTVTLEPENISPNDWTYEDGCPPDETGGGGGSEEELRGNIAQTNFAIDSTESLLALLIDGGNTEATQTDVETSVPPETMQVYSDLMNKSPYLSDTVVSTAIEKEDVLPGAMIRDIMVANPNTAKSEALMNKLDNRWDPLPEYMKAQIFQGRSIVSIREETESVLAARKLEKAKYFNALVRLYLKDTLNPQASIDSLEVLLQHEPSLNAQYRLAMLSMEQGAWSVGLGVLNSIPTQFELTASEANEHLQFIELYNLLSGMAQQEKTVFEADSIAIASLMEMEGSQSGQASVYARNILLALDQTTYEEPVLLPELLKSAIAQDEYNTLISKANEAPGYIRIKPNPAKDYIIVEYELEQETNASIDINDITGNIKSHLKIHNLQDQVTVNTRDWKPGIYIATLST